MARARHLECGTVRASTLMRVIGLGRAPLTTPCLSFRGMREPHREDCWNADARRHAEDNAARVATVAPADTLSPADRYQELFVAVQTARVFADSKTFVDCAPLQPPEAILEAYRATASGPDFDLARFVGTHFETEAPPENCYVSDPEQTLVAHIDGLWNVLTRHPREHPPRSSLLPLPNASGVSLVRCSLICRGLLERSARGQIGSGSRR